MSNMLTSPVMMGSNMMPSFDWGSIWLIMILPSVVIGAIIVLVVFLFLRNERASPSTTMAQSNTPPTSLTTFQQRPSSPGVVSGNTALADVFSSLSPTLMDDEKRVMSELVGAGGEVLQSDLPRMTDFSKATVSKAIHSLEVRGIVVREKHKWTYWCKINPRLVERVQRGEMVPPESQA